MKNMLATNVLTERGMTLIEVMVASLVGVVVVAAGFVVLTTTERATRANGQVVDTQQNVRLAMDLLARDIKAAGFGMDSAVGACNIGGNASAIVPRDRKIIGPTGALADPLAEGPDEIRLLVPSGAPTPWTLGAAVTGTASFTSVTMSAGAVADMQSAASLAANSVISIGGVSGATTTVTAATSASELISFNSIPAGMSFPIGTPVYVLQCITYDIGTTSAACGGGGTPCLRRNTIPIADGIEDIQFEYACDGCIGTVNSGIINGIVDDQAGGVAGYDPADFVASNAWNIAPMTPDKIRLVKIFIVSRQVSADQGFGETQKTGTTYTTAPLQVSNHNHAAGVFAKDDYAGLNPAYTTYRRRVLTKTVSTRNVGN